MIRRLFYPHRRDGMGGRGLCERRIARGRLEGDTTAAVRQFRRALSRVPARPTQKEGLDAGGFDGSNRMLVAGNPDIGGSRASMALMAAETLGIDYNQIRSIGADIASIGFTG